MDNDLKNSIVRTGTTILGIVCKDGIVMAADRQSTAGNLVMNKKAKKITEIGGYLLFAGTGIASDIHRNAKIVSAELRLKHLRSRKRPTVKQAANLISSINYLGIRQPSMIPLTAGILLGGFNENGIVELYSIEPAGSVMQVDDYDANFGSGMPYVLGLLERQYKENMAIKEGIELAKEAIKSSTQRDLGSGYGIDVYTITKDGIKKVVNQDILPDYKDK